MKRSISLPMLAVALLAAVATLPAVAQTFAAGTDPWTTPGGGQTTVNLDDYPVKDVLGSSITSSHQPSLKGVPLDSGLGSTDTLINRGAVTNGTGSLQIAALNLAGESAVTLADGRSYNLQVCLSDSASSAGTITLKQANSDGGTFDSSFNVLPKLVFTNTRNSNDVLTVDCGNVNCTPFTMSGSNSGWVQTGGSGKFDPASKGIPVLPTGSRSVKNCNGTHTVTISSPGGLYPGWSASAPTFPPAPPGERHDQLSWHQPLPPTDCAAGGVGTGSANAGKRGSSGKAVAQPIKDVSLCKAIIANPVGD